MVKDMLAQRTIETKNMNVRRFDDLAANKKEKISIKKHLLFLSIAIIIFIIDQLTKQAVRTNLELYQSKTVIQSILSLTYSRNTGAAFGILKDQTWVFVWLSFLVLGVILYFYDDIVKKNELSIPIALILGGVLGNLIDRIFFGYVIDFIDFHFWPIFNIADTTLTIGCVLLAITFWKIEK
jgi:signal peptidase II